MCALFDDTWGTIGPFPSNGRTDRVSFSSAQRLKIWEKEFGEAYRGRCPVCGRSITPRSFVVGHKVSLANGGTNHPRNLRPICSECNSQMSSTNWRDFEKKKKNVKTKSRRKPTRNDDPFTFWDNPSGTDGSFLFGGDDDNRSRRKKVKSNSPTKKSKNKPNTPFIYWD